MYNGLYDNLKIVFMFYDKNFSFVLDESSILLDSKT